MKKAYRIIWKIAGVLAALGVLLLLLGSVLGGAEQVRLLGNKGSALSLELHDSLHPSAKDGALLIEPGEASSVKKELCRAEEIARLKLELGGGKVVIEPAADQYVSIQTTREGISCRRDGDTLYIEGELDRSKTPGRLTLYLPKETALQELELEIGGGTLEAEQLCAEEITLEAGAGEFIIRGLTAQKAAIEAGAGKVELTDGAIEALELEVGMGELSYQGSVGKALEAVCGMGNISMELNGREEDFFYDAEEIGAVLGEVVIQGINTKDHHVPHSDQEQEGTQDKKQMHLECAMGKIEIRFQE